jgi:tetratricopeptide (TPR) repeat protein
MLTDRVAWGKYAIWGLLTFTTLDAAAFMVRNPTLSYVYFNPLDGGLKGAFGHYETDYWGISVKSALKWMEAEGILHDKMKDTITIGTTFYYPVFFQTSGKYKGMVKTVYVRFGQRYSESWDYGIFPSRFFRGPHLQAGTWPNSKAVHVVKANGVPIAAVEKDTEKFAFRGEQASKAQNWPLAISEFEAEIKQHKDNELAWLGLSNALLNTGKFSEAATAADECLKIAPDNEQGLFQKGLALINSGNLNDAAQAFERNIEVNEESYFAMYYLGIIYQQNGDADRALKNVLRALEINPRFKQAYEMAAALYEQKGDTQSAAAYRNAAAQL